MNANDMDDGSGFRERSQSPLSPPQAASVPSAVPDCSGCGSPSPYGDPCADCEVSRIMAMSDEEVLAQANPEDIGWARGFKEAFRIGCYAGLLQAAQVAEAWRDENKSVCAKARKSGNDSWADQLEGSAIECNAIAGHLRKLASGTEARQGGNEVPSRSDDGPTRNAGDAR